MLNNEFPPLGGGTGTVNLALLRQFANEPELEIDLVTSALGREYEEEQFAERIRIFKVPVNNNNIHHSSNRELLTYTIHGYRCARRLHKQTPYDLCFAWSTVPAGGISYLINRFSGLRYIVRVSGPDIPGFERRYKNIYPILTPIVKAIWNKARIVIVKCAQELGEIQAIDSGINYRIIPNGVDQEKFHPKANKSENGPLQLLCVGRLIERKGQNHLIQAVKILNDEGIDVELDLVGEGDSRKDYENLVKKLWLEDKVHLYGYVSRDQIAEYYRGADVFVLPSYNEGMSVATLEALASGMPIVSTDRAGGDNLVVEGINGFTYKWADIDSLVVNLKTIYYDRDLLKSMGDESRKRAENYSWSYIKETYLRLFKE